MAKIVGTYSPSQYLWGTDTSDEIYGESDGIVSGTTQCQRDVILARDGNDTLVGDAAYLWNNAVGGGDRLLWRRRRRSLRR
jgi:hypothetical protein